MSNDTPILKQSDGKMSNPLTSSAGDSHAKTSPLPESKQALTENAAASGLSTLDAFAHFDHATSSWRTYQVCLLTQQWDEFLETWPPSGTMQNGRCFLRPMLALPISASESGLWRTPGAEDAVGQGEYRDADKIKKRWEKHQVLLCQQVRVAMWPTPRFADFKGATKPSDCTQSRVETGKANLPEAIQESRRAVQMFPTPQARDHKDTGRNTDYEKLAKKCKLAGRVMWPTPTTPRPHDSENTVGKYMPSQNQQDLTAAVAKEGGQLSADWVEALMGFPVGWTTVAAGSAAFPGSQRSKRTGSTGSKPSATPSSRKSLK